MTTLPNKPSELIALALNDLRKVERSKKYMVDMWEWHRPINDVCCVCLAGAVIAKTLKESPEKTVYVSGYSLELYKKLNALDDLREGEVKGAFKELGIGCPNGFDRAITPYEDDSKQFKKDMRKLANDLREAGY